MKIREMQQVLDAKFLYGEELADLDVQFVFSADMMSDVLAMCGQCSVLITGHLLHHFCAGQDAG